MLALSRGPEYQLKALFEQTDVVTIGRVSGCTITLGGNDAVPQGLLLQLSRKHVNLAVKDGHLQVQDNKTLNGTYVNNQRLPVGLWKVLHHDDVISLGGTEPVAFQGSMRPNPWTFRVKSPEDFLAHYAPTAAGAAAAGPNVAAAMQKQQQQRPGNVRVAQLVQAAVSLAGDTQEAEAAASTDAMGATHPLEMRRTGSVKNSESGVPVRIGSSPGGPLAAMIHILNGTSTPSDGQEESAAEAAAAAAVARRLRRPRPIDSCASPSPPSKDLDAAASTEILTLRGRSAEDAQAAAPPQQRARRQAAAAAASKPDVIDLTSLDDDDDDADGIPVGRPSRQQPSEGREKMERRETDDEDRAQEQPKRARLGTTPDAPAAGGSSALVNTIKEQFTCPICQELIVGAYSTPCGHNFCGSCLASWLDNKQDCPNCRQRCTAPPTRQTAIDNTVEAVAAALDAEDRKDFEERKKEWASKKAEVEPQLQRGGRGARARQSIPGGGRPGGGYMYGGSAAPSALGMSFADFSLQHVLGIFGGMPPPGLGIPQPTMRGRRTPTRAAAPPRPPPVQQHEYRAEYGRASCVCESCSSGVAPNSLRLGARPQPLTRAAYSSTSWKWYHFDCFPTAAWNDARVKGVGNLRNVSPADQARIRQRL